MTINKQALIAKIKKQTESFDTVILKEDEANALLDELEAAEKYSKERDAENEDLMLAVGRLRVEREAAEKPIAELSASHSKLRETMAAIHNTIKQDGFATPIAVIMQNAKRAHEESAEAAGITVKGE
ncbi:ead/Ea22-like family protein [Lelliottia sp. T2.26D-8]|uniref:ead/Ea22-like family protein n=1 Tax=Lelliottia sp. T2.26D-8 TaxID=3041165 RepID=UPI0024773503|nr:ead/Ea22-like family protein [Lelliottia sp. T2.26D-8]CAI9399297.1 hypothetical protein CCAJJPOJ_00191 [Lelliottia sp. T2.26D-8]